MLNAEQVKEAHELISRLTNLRTLRDPLVYDGSRSIRVNGDDDNGWYLEWYLDEAARERVFAAIYAEVDKATADVLSRLIALNVDISTLADPAHSDDES